MKLLLDTHTLLWFLREPERLPDQVLRQIESAGRDALVSVVTLWEIAVKTSLNKLHLPKKYDELSPQAVPESGLSLLGIETSHIGTLSRMPWHHRDPFDRLLIAQAKTDSLTLVSLDSQFGAYGVPILW